MYCKFQNITIKFYIDGNFFALTVEIGMYASQNNKIKNLAIFTQLSSYMVDCLAIFPLASHMCCVPLDILFNYLCMVDCSSCYCHHSNKHWEKSDETSP